MFKLARRHRLEFRFDKCYFLFEEITYLGYRISAGGILPSDDNIEAALQYPLPRNTREVHTFIDLDRYFRRFVTNFSRVAKPLYDLLKKNVQFWSRRIGRVREIDELFAVSAHIVFVFALDTELRCGIE